MSLPTSMNSPASLPMTAMSGSADAGQITSGIMAAWAGGGLSPWAASQVFYLTRRSIPTRPWYRR